MSAVDYIVFLQAQDNIMNLPLANGWGEKHCLFVKWKYVEAKVCPFLPSYLLLYSYMSGDQFSGLLITLSK